VCFLGFVFLDLVWFGIVVAGGSTSSSSLKLETKTVGDLK
jgi:hypothetical protein